MAKTSDGLVNFVLGCVGRPYIYGTYGQILTERLLVSKAAQYPNKLTAARVKKARESFIGKRVSDCHGLIKNYLWAGSPDDAPIYQAAQDISADEAFNRAKVKGRIDTIPERPGVCVRYAGHVGVYIGHGDVIEARGFDYGTVKTKLTARKWSDWYEHPFIEYRHEDEEVTYMILSKGAKGLKAVKSLQILLNGYGYKDQNGQSLVVDGSYGGKTEYAVKQFQTKNGLPASGVCDVRTWERLIN